ncbi:MAG TPA: sulfurtransferase [Trebonia sp.]|nr:sulfurtransferase [Trebonia sp.]
MNAREQYLMAPAELAARLGDPGLVVLDARWDLADPDAGRRAYRAGHVPGARYVSWLDDISDPADPVPGQLASPADFARAMSAAGVDDDSTVVSYDDNTVFMAARLLWALHVYGHQRVRVLDGGWPAWVRAGGPVDTAVPAPGTGRFTPAPVAGLRLTKEEMRTAVETGEAQIADCRMDSTWQQAGAHIPGAVRLPAPALVSAGDGTVNEAASIRRLVADAGLDPDRPIALYCGGGVSAAEAFMALRTAGIRTARVYDGSWAEWGADPATPKEPHAG